MPYASLLSGCFSPVKRERYFYDTLCLWPPETAEESKQHGNHQPQYPP